MNIRTSTIDDLAVVRELNHQLFVSDSASDPTLNLDWPLQPEGEQYFTEIITGSDSICLLAEVDGSAVGYLAGSIAPKKGYRKVVTAELENMLVLPEYRSQGIGAKLVAEFSKWCKQKGAEKLIVKAYTPNARAIAFYQKAGFEPYVTELQGDL